MTKAYVLMTALPPTKGHLNLIRFASLVADEGAVVIVTTQPTEPFSFERYAAVKAAVQREGIHARVEHIHQMLEQDPSVEGFWPMWDALMTQYGYQKGDINVSSEAYGATLASRLGGTFIPYDPARELYYTKATNIRDHMMQNFADILPDFQRHMRTTVTVFGAESTGKTTLSHALAVELNAHWSFEYARPYLETVGTEITRTAMENIATGQRALQQSMNSLFDKPFVVQDTDLFSTVGYWNLPEWKSALGPVSDDVRQQALTMRSDLYIITPSNIPFEEDPLRYGGTVREGTDEYWIGICEKYGPNYVVLKSDNRAERLSEAVFEARKVSDQKAKLLEYNRHGF